MTVFFTKTCARDWERCGYQMLTIRRLFPLSTHIVMIEAVEFEKAHEQQRTFDKDLAEWMKGSALGCRTMLSVVEQHMPEAMRIENPDLRQQYCKLRAPVVFGTDMIQLDSDMCPKLVQPQWVDELFSGYGDARIRWNAPLASKAMKPAIENWSRAWQALGVHENGCEDRERDYMRSQFGWYVSRDLARSFCNEVLGADPIAKMLALVADGYKFSEYQFLGIYASATRRSRYIFFDKLEPDPWLMHFTSKESLTKEQRRLLRQAAGLED
jgi:hypothetical protein